MSREKYPEFVVARTARKEPKRQNVSADNDGLCEYSYIPCRYCLEELELLSSSLRSCKAAVIRDHLVCCTGFTGERPSKRGKSSISQSVAIVPINPVNLSNTTHVISTTVDPQEFEQMKTAWADMKRENSEMKHKMDGQQKEIKGLQDKTGLYDSVLEAVMPSLVLPLTAPEERAKITLREAAIKDITTSQYQTSASTDAVPREMHTAMLAMEKERREELKVAHTEALESYKKELEAKDSELSKTKFEKEEAEKRMQEVNKTVASLSTRTDRLQKERDALNAKYNAALKGHEQAVRSHGKHGHSQLSKLQQGQKRAMESVAMDAQTAAAVALEREFALKRAD